MFRKKFRPVYIVLNVLKVLYCCSNLFYDIPYFCFVLNLRLFCTSFYSDVVILICHLLPIRLSDSFLELCSPVKFAHSLSKKSRTVSSWEICTRIILQSMFVNQQMVKRNSNGPIVIKSCDNDVLLLSLHFYSKMTNIDKLWIQTTGIWVQDICFLQFYQ